jgi:dipeptidyl aminopeptidase/acylaminoacyl peptidase
MDAGQGRAWRLGMARGWVALVIMLLAFDAAALRKVNPGDAPALKPDEGLLVVSVDTSSPISSVRFKPVGRSRGAGLLNYLAAGRTVQLYAVPQGQYQWETVTLADTYTWRTYITLGDDPEFRFEVKPGQITYAGDLVLRPRSMRSSLVHVSNRSLPVIDWLGAQHPALYAQYPLAYSGVYPDPFPAFYREARAAVPNPPADLNAGKAAPDPGKLAITAEQMWTPDHVDAAALSPDGALIALVVRVSDRQWALELVDVPAASRQRLATSGQGFGGVEWESARNLLATTPATDGEQLHAFVIGERKGDIRRSQRFDGPVGGSVVDMLPREPGRILYEAFDSRGDLVVHRLSLESEVAFGSFRNTNSRNRLNRGVAKDLGWYADGDGVLRVALAKAGEDVVLMHGRDEQFREVFRFKGDDEFTPVRVSHDGEVIYGLTDSGRAQRDLVVFDPAQGRITRTLFTRDGTDVVRPLFDAGRNPIGVRYYQGGQLVSEYFGEQERRLDARLRDAFPGMNVAVNDRSADGQQLLLWVDASDRPISLYHLDLAKGQAQMIDEAMPGLAGHAFVPSQLLKVERPGMPSIEAFLTLPPASGMRPLVVMPHGGPVGIADRLHFDREVQFIAALGYAVLQVNFRGSDGYGRAFREAGRGQHGAGIEDDIDAAVQAALARYPLDGERMCMLGSSYGGYSALVSAIRWPGRFRCAVSLSGVSDRLLFFTASDGGRSKDGRAQLEKYIGDPRKDEAAMRATSPLYHVDQLTLPVMLVHGREDLRVDFEHTRRLVRMLNLAGRPPVVLAFPNEGHAFTDPKLQDIAWTGIAGFLRSHLAQGGAGN